MPRVLVSDTLSEAGLALLRANPDLVVEYAPGLKEPDLVAKIVDFDALVIRSGSKVTKKVIEAAQKLRVIGRAGIGVDNVDVYAASKRGILVMNTPTGNSVTTAEHAITLIMSLARKVPQATASMKAGIRLAVPSAAVRIAAMLRSQRAWSRFARTACTRSICSRSIFGSMRWIGMSAPFSSARARSWL